MFEKLSNFKVMCDTTRIVLQLKISKTADKVVEGRSHSYMFMEFENLDRSKVGFQYNSNN